MSITSSKVVVVYTLIGMCWHFVIPMNYYKNEEHMVSQCSDTTLLDMSLDKLSQFCSHVSVTVVQVILTKVPNAYIFILLYVHEKQDSASPTGHLNLERRAWTD